MLRRRVRKKRRKEARRAALSIRYAKQRADTLRDEEDSIKRLADLSPRELSALLRVPVEEAQEFLESADSVPFMQAPVEEVRKDLRRAQESGKLDKIPRDVAERWRQLRDLLYREPEFETRYPAAYGLLLEPHYREIVGELSRLLLPSFGVRILWHAPHVHGGRVSRQDDHVDAFSARFSDMEGKTPLADQDRDRLDAGYLRGLLLDILGRDEYWERVHVRHRDPELQDKLGAPDRSVVRLTDLRLAADLAPDELKRSLVRALDLLERPITAEGVIRWKRQILSLDADLVKQGFEDRKIGTVAVSFAAAAVLLFLDLDVPGMESEKSYQLDAHIWVLARTIKKLAASLDDGAAELEKLLANRAPGHQSSLENKYYSALGAYRVGTDLKLVAEMLDITPYSYEKRKGSRSWKKMTMGKLAKAEEIERKKYPRAAAIFASRDDEHVRRKAKEAHRLFTEQFSTDPLPMIPPAARTRWDWWGLKLGKKLRVNTRTKRGREITKAYVDLGFYIENDVQPLS